MNVHPSLTDDAIRAAIARRATGGTDQDLRERVLAATAVARQRRGWRVRLEQGITLTDRRATLTLAAVVLLLLAMALGAALVGRLLEPTPAPLGRLAYLSQGDLYVAGPGGESPRLVWDLPASEDQASRELIWIDPETVLLHIYDEPAGIHIVNVTTGARRLLDTGDLVAISPDRRLALVASGTPPGARKVIEIASGAVVGEFRGEISGYPPRWSPDGRSILGESSDTIYRVDIPTGERTVLATGLCCGLSEHWPMWSADGTHVVYVDYHAPVFSSVPFGEISRPDCSSRCGTLWTVAAAGGEPTRLTPELGSEILPAISPDGRWIAYLDESIRGIYPERSRLMVIAADGSGLPMVAPDSLNAPVAGPGAFPQIRWDSDSGGITYLSPAATLWHVTLNGMVATQIEAPPIAEFARQVLP